MFQQSQQIGQYTLIRQLGKGGFGEVWLAENDEGHFAVKLPHKDQVDWKSITQEIGLWTLCGKHQNIMPIIGARNFNGQIAIITEYAPDGSLEDLLRAKGKLSVEEAVEMTVGILKGLEHLHESGIIHRDLKPANILLNGKTPRLTDFGISRIISSDSLSETVSGTWAYMAPECFDGKRNIQTDIWSIGVILYRMLTGNLPFPRKEQTALIGSIIMSEPNFSIVENLPFLRRILSKILSKNPSIRYENQFLLSELTGYCDYLKRKALKNEKQEKRLKQQLIPYRKGDKWGFCSPSKDIVIEPIYDDAWEFINDLAMIELNGKRGYIDSSGTQIISINYSNSWTFNEGFARVLIKGQYSFIDKNGREITNKRFYNAHDFSDGLAAVKNSDKKWGFIDKNGNEIIDLIYEDAKTFAEGVAVVKLNGKWGFIDLDGNDITPFIFDDIWTFKEDLKTLSEGLARVYLDNKWGFINRSGEIIIDFQYQEALSFNEGLAAVSLDYYYGFIDIQNQFVIPPKYDNAKSFSENLAAVKFRYGKWGFVNKNGEEIIPFKYDDVISCFKHGLARVQVDSEYVPNDIPCASLRGQLASCKYVYIGKDGTEYYED